MLTYNSAIPSSDDVSNEKADVQNNLADNIALRSVQRSHEQNKKRWKTTKHKVMYILLVYAITSIYMTSISCFWHTL